MQPSPIKLTANPKWSYKEGQSGTKYICFDKNTPDVINHMLCEVIGMAYKHYGCEEASRKIANIETILKDYYFEMEYGEIPF